MHEITNFLPDWASPPGATISDILEERGWSVAEFASGMENSVDQAQKLLMGTAEITNDVAEQLANVVGATTGFWLSRESQFRDALARLSANEQWVKKLPISDMVNYGWLQAARDVSDKIAGCLEYFNVATVADWHERYEGGARLAAFRTSAAFEADEGALLAWLRKGEIDGAAIECVEWDRERFRTMLPSIRALTREKAPSVFIPKLRDLCAKCGVALVIARAPNGCRASGATRFLSPDKALLMLSVRYLSDDHFWFTFFHEAGHLVLHDTKALFLEGGELCSGKEEQEANAFSSDLLVPPEHHAEMLALPCDGRAVMRFAKKVGISPGIVVGQLQHRGIFSHRQMNNLKVRYSWGDN